MSWKATATVLIVVFTLVLIQSTLVGPATQITSDLNETGDYENEHFDGNTLITSWVGDWLNMGLVAIFGIMLWALARVVRRELTRGGRL